VISLNNINPALRLPDPRKFVFHSMVLGRLYGQEALGARGMKAYQVVIAQMSVDELEALGRLSIREEKRLREAARRSERAASTKSALELCAP
jgi:hypothetical protein